MFGTLNSSRASMVTTQGLMVVAKFLARNGPSGTYSHFWMSRAGVKEGRGEGEGGCQLKQAGNIRCPK